MGDEEGIDAYSLRAANSPAGCVATLLVQNA